MTRVERRARRRALLRGVRIAARRRRRGRLLRELIPTELIQRFVDSYAYPEIFTWPPLPEYVAPFTVIPGPSIWRRLVERYRSSDRQIGVSDPLPCDDVSNEPATG